VVPTLPGGGVGHHTVLDALVTLGATNKRRPGWLDASG
jgi:hypothetical protein